MTLKFPLEKATNSLSLELKKRDVDRIIPCQVKLAMDISGSFDDEHREGLTQNLLNRLVPFALLFDKDGVIDSYTFSHRPNKLPLIDKFNYDSYIEDEVIGSKHYNGGTDYLPVLKLINSEASPQDVVVEAQAEKKVGFFGRLMGKSDTPAVEAQVIKGEVEKELVFFITDGDSSPSDMAASKAYIEEMSKKNLFFVFIGVNDRDIKLFKESFENTPSSIYLHITKNEIRQLHTWTDEEMYDKLLKPSLINWMNREV